MGYLIHFFVRIIEKIRLNKQKRAFEKIWNVPKGKLQGPVWLRVEYYHGNLFQSHRVFFYQNLNHQINWLFFETKNLHASDTVNFNPDVTYEIISSREDGSFAKLSYLPKHFDAQSFSDLLNLKVVKYSPTKIFD